MDIKVIPDILRYNSIKNPEKICCVFPRDNESNLTYSELDKKSNTFADILLKKEVKKGDKVLVMTTNIPEALIVYYGLMKIGAVLVNINVSSSNDDIKNLIEKTGSRVIIYQDVFKEIIKEIKKENILFIGLRTQDEQENIHYKLIKESDKYFTNIDEEDPAIILFTSGSTGLPKGSVLTHKNFITTTKSMIERGFFKENDKVYCAQPLFYIDQTIFLHTPFMVSGTTYVTPKFSRSNFWNDIKKYNIDYVSTVPVMQKILLKDYKDEAEGHSLRVMFSTGQHLSSESLEKVEDKFKVNIVDCYGMTEGSGFSTFNYLEKDKRKKGSIGTTLSCCKHKIVDKEGNELLPNKIGEIMLKGDNQIKGYLDDEEANKKLFDKEGWMHTGDLGYYDEKGFYHIVGRIKNLIIKGGENISTLEIESMINQFPGVIDCCAAPIPDDIYGEDISCLIVKNENDNIAEKEIIDYCFKKKGKLKTPKKVFFVPELPKTGSGKHDLSKIKEMVLSLM